MSANPPTWSKAFIPDDDAEFVDDTYGAQELANMDGNDLQSLAAAHPTDEVNGHSTSEEIREALEGKERL